jgi:hypothetical protein
VGDFRNNGREYRPQGHPEEVRVHDFLIKELGRAVPYGVYDLAANFGWVSVGVDHNMGCRRPFPSGTAHPLTPPAVRKGVRLHPLELPELTFRFLAGNSVSLLDLTDELISFAFGDLPVIISQSAPFLLCLPDELLPFPFIWSVFIVPPNPPRPSITNDNPTANTIGSFHGSAPIHPRSPRPPR